MNISIIKGATIALAVLCTFAAPVIAEPLTSNQLRTLHSTDLTECAKFWFQGSRVEYCDYVRADGTIVGMRQNKSRYYATYEIRDGGCFYYRSTDGGVWDGCYYYEHKSDNVYTLTAPNRFKYDVTFVEGDQVIERYKRKTTPPSPPVESSADDWKCNSGYRRVGNGCEVVGIQDSSNKKVAPLEEAKKECGELGFKKGTEKFGDCVMKLTDYWLERDSVYPKTSSQPSSFRQEPYMDLIEPYMDLINGGG